MSIINIASIFHGSRAVLQLCHNILSNQQQCFIRSKFVVFFIWLAHGFLLPHLYIHYPYPNSPNVTPSPCKRYLTNLGYITNPVDCIFCTRHIILFVLYRRNRYNCVDINGHYGCVHNLLFPPIKIYFIGYIVNVAPTTFFLFLLVLFNCITFFILHRCEFTFR